MDDPRYGNLTPFDSDRGRAAAEERWRRHRERQRELHNQAVALLADELLESIRTYIRLRDDRDVPASTRLAAADRIVDRMIGKVGDRLELTGPDGGPVQVARADLNPAAIVAKLEQAGLVAVRCPTGPSDPSLDEPERPATADCPLGLESPDTL